MTSDYGWFLQNLEKGFIPTNMHTTVLSIQSVCTYKSKEMFSLSMLIPDIRFLKKKEKIGFGPQSCGKMKWVASPRGEKRMSLLGFFCGKKLHTSHVKLEENHSSMSSHEWLLFLDQTLFMY